MKRARLLLGLGLAFAGSCALSNGLLWQSFLTDEDVCARVQLRSEACGETPEPTECIRALDCLDQDRCRSEWSALLDCLYRGDECGQDPSGDVSFCDADFVALVECTGAQQFASCVGGNDPAPPAGCGDGSCSGGEDPCNCPEDCFGTCGAGNCGNTQCEPHLGETPDNCGQDCPDVCFDDGSCQAFLWEACPVCSCDTDGFCDPRTESATSCGDCQCNQNGVCEPGESILCPDDCRCNFDGFCNPDESAVSCSDCGGCDTGPCAVEDETCFVDAEGKHNCLRPFACAITDAVNRSGVCRSACQPRNTGGACPTGGLCDGEVCRTEAIGCNTDGDCGFGETCVAPAVRCDQAPNVVIDPTGVSCSQLTPAPKQCRPSCSSLDPAECPPGTRCYLPSDGSPGFCFEGACSSTGDCDGTGQFCTGGGGESYPGLCALECDPLACTAASCSPCDGLGLPLAGCFILPDENLQSRPGCYLAGSGVQNEACASFEDCAPGYTCDGAACRQLCRVSEPSPCPNGTCVAINTLVGPSDVGLCDN